MALLFYGPGDDPVAWRAELTKRLPDLDVRTVDAMGDPADIDMAVVWKPPPGLLASLPNLKVIFSLGAGVDGFFADPTFPDLPFCRLVDPQLTDVMAEFVLLHVLKYHRLMDRFAAAQRRAEWDFALAPLASSVRVGIMGLGVLGSATAKILLRHGYTVRGWSRTRHEVPGATCFAGTERIAEFLGGTDILVCLLPLTAETENILDAALFEQLPAGARLINVARGRHLVEEDLLAALDNGRLSHATLDVFRTEPLAGNHPFWRHPKIDITPHVASNLLPESGADGIAENIRRFRAGEPLLNLVDRTRGY